MQCKEGQAVGCKFQGLEEGARSKKFTIINRVIDRSLVWHFVNCKRRHDRTKGGGEKGEE